MNIDKILKRIKDIDNPKLNSTSILSEAPVTVTKHGQSKKVRDQLANDANQSTKQIFQDMWEKEGAKAKQDMWNAIQMQKEKGGRYKDITEKHVDFLIDVFGKKYGPQMDPNLARNVLKNPTRWLTTLNKYFHGKYEATLKQTSEKVPDVTFNTEIINNMMQSEKDIRKEFLGKFSQFIINRKKWRADKLNINLTGQYVEYYIPGIVNGIGKGKVVLDFNSLGVEDYEKVKKLYDVFLGATKNKGIAEAEHNNAGGADIKLREPTPEEFVTRIKRWFENFLLLNIGNKRHIMMTRRSIIPTGIGQEVGWSEKTLEGELNAAIDVSTGVNAHEVNQWFKAPNFVIEDGQLTSINNAPKDFVNDMFDVIGNIEYGSDKVSKNLSKYGLTGYLKDKSSSFGFNTKNNKIKRTLNLFVNNLPQVVHLNENKQYIIDEDFINNDGAYINFITNGREITEVKIKSMLFKQHVENAEAILKELNNSNNYEITIV